MKSFFFLALSAAGFFSGGSLFAETKTSPISFSRDIRPILSANCFKCHGPDDAKDEKGKSLRKAGLRLDIGDDQDWKELVTRIISTDPEEIMPPPETNKTLKAHEIALLKRWIKEGSPYEKHWAFTPPKKSPIPGNAHPVDHLFKTPLAKKADPYTLIRRVHLDLTGLPPTIEVADAFAANPTPEAFAKVVDDLLASPRYGERWARRWLDLARYADTNGYEKDRDRSIWPYRDYVIQSLNADKPFDQFTIEQLAGDMLTNATPEQIIATGFHRNTMLNEEGGIDPLEFRYHAMTDRVATTGPSGLALPPVAPNATPTNTTPSPTTTTSASLPTSTTPTSPTISSQQPNSHPDKKLISLKPKNSSPNFQNTGPPPPVKWHTSRNLSPPPPHFIPNSNATNFSPPPLVPSPIRTPIP